MSGTGNTVFATNALVDMQDSYITSSPLNSNLGYLFSGYSATTGSWYATLYKLDFAANTVLYLAGATTSAFTGNSSSPSARNNVFVWVDNANTFWMYGGNTKTSGPSNELWSYNLTLNNGQFVKVNARAMNTGTQGTPGPTVWPGYAAGGAYWFKSSTNELFLFGGYSSPSQGYQEYNNLWKYSVSLGQWTFLSGTGGTLGMGTYSTDSSANPRCRRAPGFTQGQNGDGYIFGGSCNGQLNDVWKYNNSGWYWLSSYLTLGVNDYSGGSVYPSSREHSAVWFWNNNLIIYGGYDMYSDTWLFDLDDLRWVLLRGPIDQYEPAVTNATLLEVTGLQSIGSMSGSASIVIGNNLFSVCGELDGSQDIDYIWRLNLSSSFQCSICPPGYFSSPSNLSSICTVCSPGYYSSDYSQTNCSSCSTGRFANLSGVSTCSSCSPGLHSSGSSSVCLSCAPGTSSSSGSSSCTNCSAGKYGSFSGASICSSCYAGLFSSNGSTSCMECSAGKLSSLNASQSCDGCPAGKYSNVNGSSSCLLCPLGSFSPSGASYCADCDPGKYIDPLSSNACLDCPGGKYSVFSGSMNCSTCDGGLYSLVASTTCTLCPVGKYQDSNTSASCIACPLGKYSTSLGSTRCANCPEGTYVKVNDTSDGASSCPPYSGNSNASGEKYSDGLFAGAIVAAFMFGIIVIILVLKLIQKRGWATATPTKTTPVSKRGAGEPKTRNKFQQIEIPGDTDDFS
jgi:hypothetical protein